MMNRTGDTIAAISTPQATGGIGMVRISGRDAGLIADKVFRSVNRVALASAKGYTAHYGHVYDDNEMIDEAIAIVYRQPKSYTGEDVVELSCHGGLYLIRQVLRVVLQNGARLAQPGEFTRRAFENGKISLTQAESVMDLIHAQGKQAARAAISAREGVLAQKIDRLKERIVGYAAHLAAWTDYPEEDLIPVDSAALSEGLVECIRELQKMIRDGDAGRMMRDGVDTVIVGKPNVGKSTLMNCLAGCERSIVTHIAGTTRDIVEERVVVGDVILRLADTAGIHETDDPVESIGVERAVRRMNQAELILALFDYSQPLDETDYRLLGNLKHRPCVAIVNKSDMPHQIQTESIEAYVSRVVEISAKDDVGLEKLAEEISELLGVSQLNPAAGILSGERQLQCARHCLSELQEAVQAIRVGMTLDAVGVSIDSAVAALLELSGERVTEVVTDAVFHQFCVGK